MPAGRAAPGHGERPGPGPGLGRPLRRRRSAAADPGEAGESHHQDAGPVREGGREEGSVTASVCFSMFKMKKLPRMRL